jgi:hypothetical protein
MEDMRIFTSDMPANIQIVGVCSGITKLANEVIYNIENMLISQGILAGANIQGSTNSIITTTILNIQALIIASQLPFLAILPLTEQLSSIKITNIQTDELQGSIVVSLQITSSAGASTSTDINLGV